jgi:DNA transposition AAA+ family ATPase
VNACFVPTLNFQQLQAECESCMENAHGMEIIVALGRAGRGKTTAAERIATMNGDACYVRFEGWMRPVGLLNEITFQITGDRRRTAQACRALLTDELSHGRRLVIADEADRMSLDHLNILRDLHDLFSVPIVLIGEEPLRHRLDQERRLISRVRKIVSFAPVTQSDVIFFYKQALDQHLNPRQAVTLTRHSKGDFRQVVKDCIQVERIMAANGFEKINNEVVNRIATNGALHAVT